MGDRSSRTCALLEGFRVAPVEPHPEEDNSDCADKGTHTTTYDGTHGNRA